MGWGTTTVPKTPLAERASVRPSTEGLNSFPSHVFQKLSRWAVATITFTSVGWRTHPYPSPVIVIRQSVPDVRSMLPLSWAPNAIRSGRVGSWQRSETMMETIPRFRLWNEAPPLDDEKIPPSFPK